MHGDGLLLTNHHVIERAARVFVKTHDGGIYTVKGILSEDSKHDLVLLAVEGHNFVALQIEVTKQVHPGEKVFAIGSPFGLESTLSDGIISGVRETEGNQIIQTTAPISPGSSGGALLNAEGKVVGVTSSSFEKGQNLNFAMPSAYIRPLILEARDVLPFSPPVEHEAQSSLPPESKDAHVSTFPLNWINVSERWVGWSSARSKSSPEGSELGPSIGRRNSPPSAAGFQGMCTPDGREQNRVFRCAAGCTRIHVLSDCAGSLLPICRYSLREKTWYTFPFIGKYSVRACFLVCSLCQKAVARLPQWPQVKARNCRATK